MKILRFKDWSIFGKIMSISIGTLVLISVWVLFYEVRLIEQKLLDEKKGLTKNVVDVAYSIVDHYQSKAKAGQIKENDARQLAVEALKHLRYNSDDYFWVNDLNAVMIMHPIKPEMNGKSQMEEKDPNGKRLFAEFVRVSKERAPAL